MPAALGLLVTRDSINDLFFQSNDCLWRRNHKDDKECKSAIVGQLSGSSSQPKLCSVCYSAVYWSTVWKRSNSLRRKKGWLENDNLWIWSKVMNLWSTPLPNLWTTKIWISKEAFKSISEPGDMLWFWWLCTLLVITYYNFLCYEEVNFYNGLSSYLLLITMDMVRPPSQFCLSAPLRLRIIQFNSFE